MYHRDRASVFTLSHIASLFGPFRISAKLLRINWLWNQLDLYRLLMAITKQNGRSKLELWKPEKVCVKNLRKHRETELGSIKCHPQLSVRFFTVSCMGPVFERRLTFNFGTFLWIYLKLTMDKVIIPRVFKFSHYSCRLASWSTIRWKSLRCKWKMCENVLHRAPARGRT